MCLLLKLLQIQPEKEILVEYLQADEFKLRDSQSYIHFLLNQRNYLHQLIRYLRALAAMYIRMTFRPAEVYELLEPLLQDYRKLRLRNMGALIL